MVGAAAVFRNNVVNGEVAELEGHPSPVAPAFLLAEEDVLVLAIRHWRVDVGAPGDVGAGRNQPVVEQVAHGLLQAHVDQLDGLGRDVDADPAPAQVLGGHGRGCTATKRVQDDVTFIAGRRDDVFQKLDRRDTTTTF